MKSDCIWAWSAERGRCENKDVVIVDATAPTQGLIDSVMAEVRRVALKYGVPREQLDRCVNDFAHALRPHAGHSLSPGKSPSHYKRWFQGWARGWAAASGTTKSPTGAIDHEADMRFAVAVAKKIDHAQGMTDDELRSDPFVLWVACLFDERARKALEAVP